MIFMIDNYDSFTYNLVQYLGELGIDVVVRRNDRICPEEIDRANPDRIVISPGPCTPDEAGISVEAVKYFSGKIPILGVCLGHQSIAQAFGGRVVRADGVMHGKTSSIHHDGRTIYENIENPFTATRYHSLIVEKASLPDCFEISAWTDDGIIMGIRHKVYRVEGVQFHPESILTATGKNLLKNFIEK
ncbi:MAG: aminodeoxychorismate/anthranilate synthase component II [Gemmatimonadota bacterium]|nr:MAG: aminodeoxychorismate/anthranilate synthase component II [Gemmatimonadota bacterium]